MQITQKIVQHLNDKGTKDGAPVLCTTATMQITHFDYGLHEAPADDELRLILAYMIAAEALKQLNELYVPSANTVQARAALDHEISKLRKKIGGTSARKPNQQAAE